MLSRYRIRSAPRPRRLAALLLLWTGTLLLSGANQVRAQLPVADLTSVFPPGGTAGSTLDVSTTGTNLDEGTRLVFSHAGITAQVKTAARNEFFPDPQPTAGQFTVNIAADVPPGMYDVRVIGRFGASNPRTFVVSSWPEMNDDGTNHAVASAKELPIPSVVNGLADANVIDYYKLKLTAGQRVLATVWAQQIESRMDATLAVYDARGRELARDLNTDSSDPVLEFTAPVEGEYILGVWDFFYEGGGEHFYRLNVHTDPRIDFVFPPTGLPGSTGSYTVYGRNLPGGKPSGIQLHGATLDELSVEITLPAQPDALDIADYLRPTVAQLDGVAYRVGTSLPTTLTLAKAPVVLEASTGETPDAAQAVTAPCEIAGQFYPETDEDWYVFDAKKGQTYVIDVISHRLGLATDPYLSIERLDNAADGTVTPAAVAQVDDPANRPNLIGSLFDTSTDDPSYTFTADADATYRLMVRDQFGDGPRDPRKVYRLAIRSPQPDFRLYAVPEELKVANPTEIRQTSLAIRRGATNVLRVAAERLDGYDQPIHVTVEGLPTGVTCPELILSPQQPMAWLVFTAAGDAAEWAGPIRIVGKAVVQGAEAIRIARPGAISWGSANTQQTRAEFRLAREMYLSIVPEVNGALVRVAAEGVIETSLGGTVELPIQVTRHGGFAEALKLVATNVPAELKPADIDIAADKSDGKLVIAATNASAQPGTYALFLRADSKISYSRNPEAVARAEADLAKLTEIITQLGEQVKAATAVRDAALPAAEAAATEATTAQQAQTAAAEALAAAEATLQQATEKLTAAQQAATEKPDDAALAEAVKAAEAEVATATAAKNTAAEAATKANEALEAAKVKAAAAEEAKVKAEADLKALEERAKRATDVKTADEQRIAELKKASTPADVNVALVSTPILLRVVKTPIALSAAAPVVAVKRGETVAAEIALERHYGFAGDVELTAELPADLKGVTIEKLSVPGAQPAGQFAIVTTADAPAGEFAITVRAKSQFNSIPVESTLPLTLRLE